MCDCVQWIPCTLSPSTLTWDGDQDLIADTTASGSVYQMGPLAGYIIHYHKSDAPTQTGAAWIIKGRYISTCAEVCVEPTSLNSLKAPQNPSIHIKLLNALHYKQKRCTLYKEEPTSSCHPHFSHFNPNTAAWWRGIHGIGRAGSVVCPLLGCVVLSLVF